MGQVIGQNVWVGPQFIARGTPRADVPADVVGLVGAHVWAEEGERENISPSGEALSGLRGNVWIDGVMYAKGTVPPAEVIPKVGAHLWVEGFVPPAAQAAVEAPASAGPEADPSASEPDPSEVFADPPIVTADANPDSSEPAVVSTDEGEPSPEPAPVPEDGPKPPPHSGKGSSETAWREYALKVGVHTDDANDRAEVISMIEAAGKPV